MILVNIFMVVYFSIKFGIISGFEIESPLIWYFHDPNGNHSNYQILLEEKHTSDADWSNSMKKLVPIASLSSPFQYTFNNVGILGSSRWPMKCYRNYLDFNEIPSEFKIPCPQSAENTTYNVILGNAFNDQYKKSKQQGNVFPIELPIFYKETGIIYSDFGEFKTEQELNLTGLSVDNLNTFKTNNCNNNELPTEYSNYCEYQQTGNEGNSNAVTEIISRAGETMKKCLLIENYPMVSILGEQVHYCGFDYTTEKLKTFPLLYLIQKKEDGQPALIPTESINLLKDSGISLYQSVKQAANSDQFCVPYGNYEQNNRIGHVIDCLCRDCNFISPFFYGSCVILEKETTTLKIISSPLTDNLDQNKICLATNINSTSHNKGIRMFLQFKRLTGITYRSGTEQETSITCPDDFVSISCVTNFILDTSDQQNPKIATDADNGIYPKRPMMDQILNKCSFYKPDIDQVHPNFIDNNLASDDEIIFSQMCLKADNVYNSNNNLLFNSSIAIKINKLMVKSSQNVNLAANLFLSDGSDNLKLNFNPNLESQGTQFSIKPRPWSIVFWYQVANFTEEAIDQEINLLEIPFHVISSSYIENNNPLTTLRITVNNRYYLQEDNINNFSHTRFKVYLDSEESTQNGSEGQIIADIPNYPNGHEISEGLPHFVEILHVPQEEVADENFQQEWPLSKVVKIFSSRFLIKINNNEDSNQIEIQNPYQLVFAGNLHFNRNEEDQNTPEFYLGNVDMKTDDVFGTDPSKLIRMSNCLNQPNQQQNMNSLQEFFISSNMELDALDQNSTAFPTNKNYCQDHVIQHWSKNQMIKGAISELFWSSSQLTFVDDESKYLNAKIDENTINQKLLFYSDTRNVSLPLQPFHINSRIYDISPINQNITLSNIFMGPNSFSGFLKLQYLKSHSAAGKSSLQEIDGQNAQFRKENYMICGRSIENLGDDIGPFLVDNACNAYLGSADSPFSSDVQLNLRTSVYEIITPNNRSFYVHSDNITSIYEDSVHIFDCRKPSNFELATNDGENNFHCSVARAGCFEFIKVTCNYENSYDKFYNEDLEKFIPSEVPYQNDGIRDAKNYSSKRKYLKNSIDFSQPFLSGISILDHQMITVSSIDLYSNPDINHLYSTSENEFSRIFRKISQGQTGSNLVRFKIALKKNSTNNFGKKLIKNIIGSYFNDFVLDYSSIDFEVIPKDQSSKYWILSNCEGLSSNNWDNWDLSKCVSHQQDPNENQIKVLKAFTLQVPKYYEKILSNTSIFPTLLEPQNFIKNCQQLIDNDLNQESNFNITNLKNYNYCEKSGFEDSNNAEINLFKDGNCISKSIIKNFNNSYIFNCDPEEYSENGQFSIHSNEKLPIDPIYSNVLYKGTSVSAASSSFSVKYQDYFQLQKIYDIVQNSLVEGFCPEFGTMSLISSNGNFDQNTDEIYQQLGFNEIFNDTKNESENLIASEPLVFDPEFDCLPKINRNMILRKLKNLNPELFITENQKIEACYDESLLQFAHFEPDFDDLVTISYFCKTANSDSESTSFNNLADKHSQVITVAPFESLSGDDETTPAAAAAAASVSSDELQVRAEVGMNVNYESAFYFEKSENMTFRTSRELTDTNVIDQNLKCPSNSIQYYFSNPGGGNQNGIAAKKQMEYQFFDRAFPMQSMTTDSLNLTLGPELSDSVPEITNFNKWVWTPLLAQDSLNQDNLQIFKDAFDTCDQKAGGKLITPIGLQNLANIWYVSILLQYNSKIRSVELMESSICQTYNWGSNIKLGFIWTSFEVDYHQTTNKLRVFQTMAENSIRTYNFDDLVFCQHLDFIPPHEIFSSEIYSNQFTVKIVLSIDCECLIFVKLSKSTGRIVEPVYNEFTSGEVIFGGFDKILFAVLFVEL